MKLVLLILSLSLSNFIYSQNKLIKSNLQIITIANGANAYSSSNNLVYILMYINQTYGTDKLGLIRLTDVADINNNSKTYLEEFQIYAIDKKDNGNYNYWTSDLSNNQTVLFQLNQSGIKNKITFSRYIGKSSADIIKQIDYYFD